jgi:PiT family inorganic phosphate transporter
MSLTTVLVFILVAVLAAVNGSNDVPKGVATLAGAGVTKYKTAILWGTVTTLVGCVCSLALASKMTKLFSGGIITAKPTDAFAVAVLVGAASWVALATVLRLPVSTTHALIGGLLGAGLLMSSEPETTPVVAATAGPDGAAGGVSVLESTKAPAQVTEKAPNPVLTAAHWLTSGATGFARGLNDTPKMVAIGAFALVPAGMKTWQIMLLVAGAMAAGSIFGGMRIAESLGEGVVKMNHKEGFLANLTTAALVGMGAGYGLPMSTTHVSTGAIAGSAGPNLSRLSGKTLRNFLIAWLVTPPFAAGVAALVYLIAR